VFVDAGFMRVRSCRHQQRDQGRYQELVHDNVLGIRQNRVPDWR
jgi:hypothetical protein